MALIWGGGGDGGLFNRGANLRIYDTCILCLKRFWRTHKFMLPRCAKRLFSVFSYKVRKTLAP